MITRSLRSGYRGRLQRWGSSPFLLLLILFGAKQWSEERHEISRGGKQRGELKGEQEFTRGKKMKVRAIAHSESVPGDLGEGRLQEREGLPGCQGLGAGRGHTPQTLTFLDGVHDGPAQGQGDA